MLHNASRGPTPHQGSCRGRARATRSPLLASNRVHRQATLPPPRSSKSIFQSASRIQTSSLCHPLLASAMHRPSSDTTSHSIAHPSIHASHRRRAHGSSPQEAQPSPRPLFISSGEPLQAQPHKSSIGTKQHPPSLHATIMGFLCGP